MHFTKTKVNFKDQRGEIRDLLTHQPINAITLITCAKGAVRGNHWHKKTTQHTYVLVGKFLSVCVGKNGRAVRREVVAGDLLTHDPGEVHTFKAISKGILMQFSYGPRCGKDYEKDTFRLAQSLL